MSKSTKKPPTKAKKPKKPSKRVATVVAKAQAETVPEKRGRGRPTDYKPEYAKQVFKFCLLGAKDKEIADLFGVTTQTINNWKHDFPEFFDALVKGKEKADAEIAHSLYKKAKGYTYKTERMVGKGEDRKVVTVKVHVPPDASSQQFWMRNRRRQDWADTKQVEVGGPGDFDQMSIEELRAFLAEDDVSELFGATPGSDSIN